MRFDKCPPNRFLITYRPRTGFADGGIGPITITCKPTATGAKTATLHMTPNNTAEGTVDFGLTCTGISSNNIFSDGLSLEA